jgi:hypothetical protein
MQERPTRTENRIYRQGDILLRSIEKIHRRARRCTPDGPIILAEGEVTGHYHAILDPTGVELYRIGEQRAFLVVEEPGTTLSHPEHAPIELPAGPYEVVRQREYRPDLRKFVHVSD